MLVDGAPVLYVEPKSGKVTTFTAASDAELELAIAQGLHAVAGAGRRSIVIASVDGEAALMSRWAPAFDHAGFRRDYRGFVSVPGWERKPSPPPALPRPAPEPEPDEPDEPESPDDDDELDDGGEDL